MTPPRLMPGLCIVSIAACSRAYCGDHVIVHLTDRLRVEQPTHG